MSEVQDYAILMLDVAGKVATWNAGAQRFKGYEASELGVDYGQGYFLGHPAPLAQHLATRAPAPKVRQ